MYSDTFYLICEGLLLDKKAGFTFCKVLIAGRGYPITELL